MNKCALCGKGFNSNEAEFGLGCLKRLGSSMDAYDIKDYRDEKKLNKKICKVLGKENLPNEQSKLLTNRYCTLKLLNEVKLEEYDKYRSIVENDIYKINRVTTPDELKSFKKITLKQANEINRHYKKYKNVFKKINDGDYDAGQYITSGLIRFAFSRYYAKKPYLSDMIQLLQVFILKAGIEYLKNNNWDFSAECLEHALLENPADIEIRTGKVISKIKKDSKFKATIDSWIENKKILNLSDNIEFNTGDLLRSLHGATLIANGKKQNGKWNLDITITDLYDFTELKKIQDYMKDKTDVSGFALSFGNNLAMVATSCNVVHKYNITIKFNMEI